MGFDDRDPKTASVGSTKSDNVPLPFDHFFFCFLPPVDAAGA
jgi:hypothetical protein